MKSSTVSVAMAISLLKKEVKRMTPEERVTLVKNIARLKELAKELTERDSIIRFHIHNVGC